MIPDSRLFGWGLSLAVAVAGCSKPPAPVDSLVALPSAAATPTELLPSAPVPSAPVPAKVSSPSDEPSSSAASAACDALFEPPPGARLLCSEHVLGNNMEIAWRSYATSQSGTTLFAPYHAKAAECATVKEGPGLRLERDLLHLTVHAATEQGYPTCGKKPAAGEASVMVISQAYKR